jgi:asparagine synthase (glutamine-hydrolysing)
MKATLGILRIEGDALDQESVLQFQSALRIFKIESNVAFADDKAVAVLMPSTAPFILGAIASNSSKSLLCWFGRLDNKDELLRDLTQPRASSHSDADVVLATYEKHPDDWLHRIVGDFSVSLWDSRRKKLLLARDAAGTRMLYYHLGSRYLLWAHSLKILRAAANASTSISDDYIATYLIGQPEPNLTPFKEIFAVPPGHFLEIRNGNVVVKRYWAPDPGEHLICQKDQEYEERFFHLFRQAVRYRLPAKEEIWAELSGGLDSSSIVCMADDILASGESTASGLQTVSYTFEHSKTSDERREVLRVESMRGKQGCHITEDEQEILEDLLSYQPRSVPNPLDCFSGREKRLREHMRKRGARVLLSGHGGDHLLWSAVPVSPELSDFLVQGCLSALIRSSREWTKIKGLHLLGVLWQGALEPCLPWAVRRLVPSEDLTPRWINVRFARRTGLRERLVRPQEPFGFNTPAKRKQASMLFGGIISTAAGSYQDFDFAEVAYPFQDRRLIEFMLSIPVQQLLRPGDNRSLQRRALQHLLPRETVQRKSKKGPAEAILRAIARKWETIEILLQSAQIYERGFIDRKILLDTLNRSRMGESKAPILILGALALECWLRQINSSNGRVQSRV